MFKLLERENENNWFTARLKKTSFESPKPSSGALGPRGLNPSWGVNGGTGGSALNSVATTRPLDTRLAGGQVGERRRTLENGYEESVALHATSTGNTSTSD